MYNIVVFFFMLYFCCFHPSRDVIVFHHLSGHQCWWWRQRARLWDHGAHPDWAHSSHTQKRRHPVAVSLPATLRLWLQPVFLWERPPLSDRAGWVARSQFLCTVWYQYRGTLDVFYISCNTIGAFHQFKYLKETFNRGQLLTTRC